MSQQIERGRLKEPPAPEVSEIMVEPCLSPEEVARSYQHYIDINKAHVLMLARQNIIGKPAAAKILNTAIEMAAMGDTPTFEISPLLEEMYFNLENYLINQVGMEVGGQQHTARSRNDLHATVDRMEIRQALLALVKTANALRRTLIALAEKNRDSVMSGYTHLQPSEPMTFAFYLSAVLAGIQRDVQRIKNAWEPTNKNPLGGGSMGSTTWQIDRDYTAELLGFDGIVDNALDCVCSRDYLIELMNGMSTLALTLARMTTDIRIWATPDYNYVEVSDAVAVCSSIMPQKKNPWTFESTASFSARVKGAADSAWMTYKGVPYAFTMESMDLIANFWPAFRDLNGMLRLMEVSMKGIKVRTDKSVETAKGNFSTVTELANTLVRSEGMSFRLAHEIVAHIVGYLVENNKKATEIDRRLLNEIAEPIVHRELKITDEEIQKALDPVMNAHAKTVKGGTSPDEVQRQLDNLARVLEADENFVREKEAMLKDSHEKLSSLTEEFVRANLS